MTPLEIVDFLHLQRSRRTATKAQSAVRAFFGVDVDLFVH